MTGNIKAPFPLASSNFTWTIKEDDNILKLHGIVNYHASIMASSQLGTEILCPITFAIFKYQEHLMKQDAIRLILHSDQNK